MTAFQRWYILSYKRGAFERRTDFLLLLANMFLKSSVLNGTTEDQRVIAASEDDGLTLRYCLMPMDPWEPSQVNLTKLLPFQPTVMVVST